MSSVSGATILEQLAARLAEVEQREQEHARRLAALERENTRLRAENGHMREAPSTLLAPAPCADARAVPSASSASALPTAGAAPSAPTGPTSRRGLLRTALGAAAATVGASALLETNQGAALANGVEGQTTFLSNTGTPTVTAKNSGSGTGVYGSTASTAANATAIHGVITNSAAGLFSAGVQGDNNGSGAFGIGVYGTQAGAGAGVRGDCNNGSGVYGTSNNGTGVAGSGATGVAGTSISGTGVKGVGGASVGGVGVFGGGYTGVNAIGDSTAGTGVAGSGFLGVQGTSSSGTGVYGSTGSTAANATAIHGVVTSTSPGSSSAALRAENLGTGPLGIGVWGSQNGSGWGGYFTSASGIGVNASGFTGVSGTGNGTSSAGVLGTGYGNNSIGVSGSGFTGVQGAGDSTSGIGVSGSGFTGMQGTGDNNSIGVSGSGGTGVSGTSTITGVSSGMGVSGSGHIGVKGTGDVNTFGVGVLGIGYLGVQGAAADANSIGLYGIGGAYAGYFSGNVQVAGTLSKSGGSFKIDHPLAPARKYLLHSFVESPDMKNVYDGVTTLDAAGRATVALPAWFGALNKDFRYQLTPIGAPGAGLYVAQEITRNRFTIAGGAPGLKVCWQVTGIRQDAWANAHRIPVEQDKPARERGYYLYPELHGAPEEKSIAARRHPRPAVPASPRSAGLQQPAAARQARRVHTVRR